MLPEKIGFTKLSAGGNDFVCLDNTKGEFNLLLSSNFLPVFVQQVCRRGLSIGADGVIFACHLGSHNGIDVVARFFEPDGSEVELCGNGTACFTYWVVAQHLLAGPEVLILTAAGTAKGRVDIDNSNRVTVCVPDPKKFDMNVELEVENRKWTLDCVQNGVPHAITFVDDLQNLDVAHWGSLIRHHERFQPRGMNVNFVKVLDVGHIAIRTFEFGVEGETLACGTGSATAAIVSCLRFAWPEEYRCSKTPVKVEVRGEETLKISFACTDQSNVTDVCLETRARAIYEGEFRPEFLQELTCIENQTRDC